VKYASVDIAASTLGSVVALLILFCCLSRAFVEYTCSATVLKHTHTHVGLHTDSLSRSATSAQYVNKTKLRGLSPLANYTDRAAAAGRRS